MKCENTSVMLSIKPIAYIHSDFSEKFGIPRQSGLVDSLQAKIIFTEEFRNGDCIRGIEEFSHLWLIWEFSKNQRDKWTPTVRPPRLGGNKRKGVFPAVLLFAQIRSDYPVSVLKRLFQTLQKAPFFMFPVQIY